MSASNGYERGVSQHVLDAAVAEIGARWGEPVFAEQEAPSLAGDDAFRRWWATYLRSGSAPSGAASLFRTSAALDVRDSLAAVRAPTLVLHRVGDLRMPIAGARDLARSIPQARLVELEGGDHLPYAGDMETLLREVERFVSGPTRPV